MNKKSIGALLLSAALLVGSTGATFAYFTNYAQSDKQIITLGDVKVQFMPNSGTKWAVKERASSVQSALQSLATLDFKSALDLAKDNNNEINTNDPNQIYYLAPGDVIAKSFTLKNTGKLDAKIKLSLEELKVLDKNGGTVTNTSVVDPNKYLVKAYHVDPQSGTPGSEIDVTLVTNNNGQGNFILDAASQEEVVIYVGLALDNSIGNSLMDSQVQFNLRADATQWNNPGWGEQ